MKRTLTFVGATLAVALLAGCVPEEKITWSPDGRWAAVRGGDGLYLCDEQGVLHGSIAGAFSGVAWAPDAQRLVVVRTVRASTWGEVTQLLPAERVERLVNAARDIGAEVLAFEGDFSAFVSPKAEAMGSELAMVLLYLRDNDDGRLREKLGDKWNDLASAQAHVYTLELAHVRNDRLEPGAVLLTSSGEIASPLVSPKGGVVAYTAERVDGGAGPGLCVLPLSGGQPRTVAEHTAPGVDWSPDGRHLAYAEGSAEVTSSGREGTTLGVIARREVCDADGALLAEFPAAEELAGILFYRETKVSWLPDGRVMFVTMEVHLPCTTKDMPEMIGLFVVDPERQPTVTRLLPRQARPDELTGLYLYGVSPDGRRVCYPGNDGEVRVLTLRTGDIWTVVSAEEGKDAKIVPVWRSHDELCVQVSAAAADAAGRSQLALCKLDYAAPGASRRVISVAWPESMVTGLLVAPAREQRGGE